ncbi:MAG: DUF2914 domain-containing protein [Bacteroidota bacterium]|nr:DUF2914 domain-containing protein [Bacteroidota bacterium]
MKRFSALTGVLIAGILNISDPAQSQEKESGGIQIIDAKLGKDVKDRMIVDEDSSFAPESKVFLWLKVIGGTNETVVVIWKQNASVHETKLPIGGSPWRTWASKTAYKSGNWTVTITDNDGKVLKELNFIVQ